MSYRIIMFRLKGEGAISYIHQDEISGYDDIRIFLLNFLKEHGIVRADWEVIEAAVLEFPDSEGDYDDIYIYTWSMAEPDSPYLIFAEYFDIWANVRSGIVRGIEDIYNKFLTGVKNES